MDSTPVIRAAIPSAPADDAAAIGVLADAYRRAADILGRRSRQATAIGLGAFAAWAGPAATAAHGPLDVLTGSDSHTVRALRHTADWLDDYAAKLEAAKEAHHWSLGKLAELGAVVAVTAGVTYVTLGAATAAVGGAAYATAESLLASATTAGEVMLSGAELEAADGALAMVRALAAYLAPQVAANTAGALAGQAVTGDLDAVTAIHDGMWGAFGGLVGGPVFKVSERMAASLPQLSRAAPMLSSAYVSGTTDTADQLVTTGRVDPGRVGMATAAGGADAAVEPVVGRVKGLRAWLRRSTGEAAPAPISEAPAPTRDASATTGARGQQSPPPPAKDSQPPVRNSGQPPGKESGRPAGEDAGQPRGKESGRPAGEDAADRRAKRAIRWAR